MTKIIIAEDSDIILNLQEDILKMEFPKYELENFKDGNSLDRKLNESLENISLIITDNEMPGISGSEIIKKYTKDERFREIPFILCYGGTEEIGKKAIENGAYAYILKPLDIKKYVEIVKKVLNRNK